MGDFVEILNSPLALTALIVLSILSSYFLWVGMRERDVPKILFGIGTLIPTFDLLNWKAWALGATAGVVGFWLRAKLDF